MIYLCISSYFEAEPFIKELSLKKVTSHHKFIIYKNEHYALIISGSGMIHQAMAVTYLFDHSESITPDYLIHIGTAKSIPGLTTNGPYLITSIYHKEEDIMYYPDVLYKHPFKEAALCTASHISQQLKFDLFDDQAAAIFESAAPYLTVDKLIFLKYTDKMDDVLVQTFLSFLSTLTLTLNKESLLTYTTDEKESMTCLLQILNLTSNQQLQLSRHLQYEKIKQGSILPCITPILLTIKSHGCNSKREGKIYLEQLFQSIIES